MTTRRLLLPTLCIAMGCYAPVEQPNADDRPVTEEKSNLPVAPAPRPKGGGKPKPWSELIVGKWKAVEMNGQQVPPEWSMTRDFTPEGKYTVRSDIPKRPLKLDAGTYKLNGNVIRFTRPASANGPERSWEVTIEALSEDQFTVVAGPPDDRQRSVYKRVLTK